METKVINNIKSGYNISNIKNGLNARNNSCIYSDPIREEAFAGKPVSVPVIDSHSHICAYYNSGWYQSFTSNKEVISLMEHLGIDCIITAPHILVAGRMEDANKAADRAAKEFPGRIYGYISICPHEGINAIKDAINNYSKNSSFIGMKFLPGYHGPLACIEYDYALDFANEVGCPVLIHTWSGSPGLNEFERVVKTRSNLKLMVAHQGGGNGKCTDDLAALMKQYPNLYMEICGSLFNQYSIEDMVGMAGEDRVIYGSDMINLDPRYDFGRVVLSTLSYEVKKKILAENFLSLLQNSQMGKVACCFANFS